MARKLHMRLGKVQLRRASGHEPQYNEPGGYLFGEKVSRLLYYFVLKAVNFLSFFFIFILSALTTRTKTRERRLGKYMDLWYGWKFSLRNHYCYL
jgi:hypothetical protein